MNRIAKTLQQAKQVIVDQGWRQGRRPRSLKVDPKQACCMYDAFYVLPLKRGEAARAILFLNSVVLGLTRTERERARDGINDWRKECSLAVQWNDAPGRTKEEVLDAFDKAFARAK